jgi:hypothetical protein
MLKQVPHDGAFRSLDGELKLNQEITLKGLNMNNHPEISG